MVRAGKVEAPKDRAGIINSLLLRLETRSLVAIAFSLTVCAIALTRDSFLPSFEKLAYLAIGAYFGQLTPKR